MIKIHKQFKLTLVLFFFLSACQNDPDSPLTDPIQSYFIIYNFLTESYDVDWEINGELIESSQAYGSSMLDLSELEENKEDIPFVVKESGSMRVIHSETYPMEQYYYYLVAIMGTEHAPYLLFEPMDLRAPSKGMVKLRLMQTATEVGPVDLYIGGNTPDHKVFSGISYTGASDYIEASEEDLWEAIIITPFDISPSDSTILYYTANNIFVPDQVYLGVMGHSSSSPSSSLQLLLYDQPMGL